MSSRRLQDLFAKHLQDVVEDENLLRRRRLKTSKVLQYQEVLGYIYHVNFFAIFLRIFLPIFFIF